MVPVLQPIFLHFHGDTYLANLTEADGARLYPVRTLLDAGCVVAGSSDGPVVPDRNPLAGIRTAITRKSAEGRPAAAGEAVSLATALRLYTANAAFAAHEEHEKGTLATGKLADLVVLDEDVTAVPAEELAGVGVREVFVDGERVTDGA
jgi:predicted amidohydrolase YtcJ